MNSPLINVIGLGNLLYGDEGFGVAALNSFRDLSDFPETVRCIDGGTQGIYLLDYIESCDAVMVFDALIPLDYERRVYVYRNEELPAFIHRKMSSHQMGLSEMWFGWMIPLFGGSYTLHFTHHLGSWMLPIYVIMHLYAVIRHDVVDRTSVTSSIITGYKHKVEEEPV